MNDEILKKFEEAKNEKWEQVLHDEGTKDWRDHWFLDGTVAQVTNDEKGMTFAAGNTFLDETHHGVLWTKQSFKGDLRIEYDFTRLDEETRCVNILFVQAKGIGEGVYDEDISKWNDLRITPRMSLYFEKMYTYHISYAAFPNGDNIEPGYIRARRYMGGPLDGTEMKPEYDPEDFFNPNEVHHMTLIKKDQQLFLQISNDKKEKLCYWNNQEFPPISEGRVGLRQMFTRKSRYANIQIYTK